MTNATRIIAVKFSKGIKGFTLIELMVAVAILMISMTAILHATIHYHRINIENAMRNESMRVVEAQVEELRGLQFTQLVPGGPYTPADLPTPRAHPTRRIRNIDVTYTVNWTIQSISANSVAVRVNTTWGYRGITHRHSASTIISTEV